MSIWGTENPRTFSPGTSIAPSQQISFDLLIAKATPAVVFQGSESNARQCAVREVAGVFYFLNNADWNGTAFFCVNTASEADALSIDASGNINQLTHVATVGTWTPAQWVNNASIAKSGAVIAPTIGPVAGQQHTVPAVASDTIALLAAVQTLTNKTLTGNIAGTLGPAAGQQHTFPAVASDTIALLAAAQTFTNKTLTSPVIGTQITPTGTVDLGLAASAFRNIFLSGTLQNNGATATMGITEKRGSAGGNYTTTSATFVKFDATNLQQVVTIPSGWKLLVVVTGTCNVSVSTSAQIALFDGASELSEISVNSLTSNDPFSLSKTIVGDGASHTISLQGQIAGANTLSIVNSSVANSPCMQFVLMPSN